MTISFERCGPAYLLVGFNRQTPRRSRVVGLHRDRPGWRWRPYWASRYMDLR